MLMLVCLGCLERYDESLHAISRYGHGRICSPCGMKEAFGGDFIARQLQPEPDNLSEE